jgi:hypothetical protein
MMAKIRFVSALTKSKLQRTGFNVLLNDTGHKITGLPKLMQFTVDPMKPHIHVYPITSQSIELPSEVKKFEENAADVTMVNLPPTTSVVLNAYNASSNTFYSNSGGNTLLAYIASNKRLYPSETFVFTGTSNLLCCQFYNQLNNSFIKWPVGTEFTFVFRRV